jgi:hypothetical protein
MPNRSAAGEGGRHSLFRVQLVEVASARGALFRRASVRGAGVGGTLVLLTARYAHLYHKPVVGSVIAS